MIRTRQGRTSRLPAFIAASLSGLLILAACGGDDDDSPSAAPSAPIETETDAPAPEDHTPAPEAAPDPEAAPIPEVEAPSTPAAPAPPKASASAPRPSPKKAAASDRKPAAPAPKAAAPAPKPAAPAPKKPAEKAPAPGGAGQPAPAPAQPPTPAGAGGATDRGVTPTEIKLGSIQMHGMPLGNLLVDPQVRGNNAALKAINDAGGVHGRKLTHRSCDDGPGETSRAKACMKKLVDEEKIFALLTGVTWSSIPITNDDLERTQTPWIGAWSYGFVEWTNPWSFPAHMSMMSEANANAEWVRDVIKPKTFGLICLNAPEMQRSCDNVNKVLTDAGAKLVHKVNVSLTPGDLSAEVIAMRAAEPDHIVHYVINPASIAKFVVDATQQQYWPPKGMSGNHLAAEILGEIFGEWPVDRYWTNTTFKLWGPEFMATMRKYAPNNEGMNHHIVQSGFVGANILADALQRLGPDVTREKLMQLLHTPGTMWETVPSLDQKFWWSAAERFHPESAGRREFMYKYTSSNTVAKPDTSPNGFTPDPDKFVITDTQPLREEPRPYTGWPGK